MCRICGRMVKCIFDSMPSRTASTTYKRAFTTLRKNTGTETCPKCPTNGASTRQALRIVLQVQPPYKSGPPPSSFLLPFRAPLHTTAHKRATTTAPTQFQQSPVEIPPNMLQSSEAVSDETHNLEASQTSLPPESNSLVLSKSLHALLPALAAQKPHYMTAHIHRFPYLITAGDTLRLPFHMGGVSPGDILRLNRASLLGSRDFTLKAGTTRTETYDGKRTGWPQYLDERLFECRARVMGVETTPMQIEEKTKRRQRRVKRVKSKHRYTVLKIMEIKVKSLEELKAEPGLNIIIAPQ